MTPTFRYQAVVQRVVDGDTVDMSVDLGFRVWVHMRFRLLRVNTPERGKPGWAEATEFVRQLLPVGQVVVAETTKPPTDKYGRWLAEIYVDDQCVNQLLLDTGHAVPY